MFLSSGISEINLDKSATLAAKQELLRVDTCIPIRRHSYSAPPRLLLEGCLAKVDRLSKQVDRVLDSVKQVRSKSVPDLTCEAYTVVDTILDQILTTVVGSSNRADIMTKPRQCHHCHRPVNHPDHTGIMSGINQCTLEHYELCPGGRRTGKDWTGCPEDEYDSDDDSHAQSNPDTITDIEDKPANDLLPDPESIAGKLDPAAIARSLLIDSSKAEYVTLDEGELSEDTDDEEESLLQEEVARLKLQVEQETRARLELEEQAKKDKKRLKQERLARLEKQKADLITQSRAFQTRPVAPTTKDRLTEPVYRPVVTAEVTTGKTLQDKAADLAAKQQRKAVKGLHQDIEGLTIAGIRALPGMTPEVEQWMTSLQGTTPSLAKAATAPSASGVSFQPDGVLSGQHSLQGQPPHLLGQAQGGGDIDSQYVYSASRGTFVPVVHDSPNKGRCGILHPSIKQPLVKNVRRSTATSHLPTQARYEEDDELTSEDEDCPMEPAPGHEFVWYRDKQDKKYFVHRLAQERPSPEMIKSYACDEATGRWYETLVPKDSGFQPGVKTAKSSHRKSLSTPVYIDHRKSSSSPVPQVTRGVRTPAAPAHPPKVERHPGFITGESEKQGRDSKVPDLVQWARNCPVNWTTKVTSDKINAVLWAWAFVSELLATRTGQAPNLPPGELEARLQHFCHVLEITLQSSSQSDFCGDAWMIGRLYDQKVQQKVDSNQFSWVQLSAMNHGASHPHELMAAHQELTKKPKREQTNLGDGKGGTKTKPKRKCHTWNRSEVKGKCTWEVENAPDKCMFSDSHECSYCKYKNLTPVNHQRHFCKKRLEQEG